MNKMSQKEEPERSCSYLWNNILDLVTFHKLPLDLSGWAHRAPTFTWRVLLQEIPVSSWVFLLFLAVTVTHGESETVHLDSLSKQNRILKKAKVFSCCANLQFQSASMNPAIPESLSHHADPPSAHLYKAINWHWAIFSGQVQRVSVWDEIVMASWAVDFNRLCSWNPKWSQSEVTCGEMIKFIRVKVFCFFSPTSLFFIFFYHILFWCITLLPVGLLLNTWLEKKTAFPNI